MGTASVEILLAAYNGARFIREQMDSILHQTDTRWHLTVSDDGSTDGTEEIIDDYARRYPDRVQRVRAGRRFGSAKAHFFWLTERCDADYIAYCDDDDVWNADKLEKMCKAMRNAESRAGRETPILVFSDQTVTDDRLNVLSPSLMRYQKQYFAHFDYRSILMQNVVTGGAMMINRALAGLALECKNVTQIIMHDWWMAAVAARFGEIVYIDEALGAYRQHGRNCVGAKNVASAAHILHKLSHPNEIRGALRSKKLQARVFVRTYESDLNEKDRGFLDCYGKKRSGPFFYWKHRALIHGRYRLAGMMLLG